MSIHVEVAKDEGAMNQEQLGNIRKTSEVEDFPWKLRTLCWITERSGVVVGYARAVGEKRDAIEAVKEGRIRLFIAWPGEWRTDLFEVDNIEAVVV